MREDNLKFNNVHIKLRTIEDLISSMEQWYRKWIIEDEGKHKIDGHNFNVFSLWNRISHIKEPMHSQLLYFILSNDEMHGQDNKFLIKFLERLDISDSEVGEWKVTAEEGRVDVMLKRENPFSVIIIENKSNNADDMEGQLYRYWYQNIHKKGSNEDLESQFYEGNKNLRIIYLAPNKNKFYVEQSCRKPSKVKWFKHLDMESYKNLPDLLPIKPDVWTFDNEIQSWLDDCIRLLDDSNNPIREFLNQYKHYCKTLNNN